jgi:hypothetical protein
MTVLKTHLSKIKQYKDNTCKDYSISKILREQKKSNDFFETMLCNISLEDIIALRLELAYKTIGVRLYGFPIWRNTTYIVKEALLKYAVSISTSKGEAARYLGLHINDFLLYLKKYQIDTYFKRKKINDDNRNTA